MIVTAQKIEQQIKEEARRIGFSHAGLCALEEGESVRNLSEWLRREYHGRMKYMEDERRQAPEKVLSGVRTIIVVGLNYRWADGAPEQEAVISKYAWSQDYHRIMKPMLADLARFLITIFPAARTKSYVDTGPLVEKYWAQKAGIGWIGKHTNVLSQRGSSWLFLGAILTDLVLEADSAAIDHCGTCERCIEICPTRAIIAPYVLDSRLCISYLTIELRDSIPRELRPMIGNRIFGCDDCQDVCPWNRFAHAGDPRFTPKPEILTARLIDYLQMDADQFRKMFAGTNVLRAKYRGFLRNCLVAAGNARKPELKQAIQRHLSSEDEMVREHAVWALAQYGDPGSMSVLKSKRETEQSSQVLGELDHWIRFHEGIS